MTNIIKYKEILKITKNQIFHNEILKITKNQIFHKMKYSIKICYI